MATDRDASASIPGNKRYHFVEEPKQKHNSQDKHNKRQRLVRACRSCRKRKIRCESTSYYGTWPCRACIRFRVDCHPPTPDQIDEHAGLANDVSFTTVGSTAFEPEKNLLAKFKSGLEQQSSSAAELVIAPNIVQQTLEQPQTSTKPQTQVWPSKENVICARHHNLDYERPIDELASLVDEPGLLWARLHAFDSDISSFSGNISPCHGYTQGTSAEQAYDPSRVPSSRQRAASIYDIPSHFRERNTIPRSTTTSQQYPDPTRDYQQLEPVYPTP
jgi:hypothetical protein